MTDSDNADGLTLLANTSVPIESLLHGLEGAAGWISLYLNPNKTEFMYFKQEGAIYTLKFVK